ncbi:unnamed protein product [Rotaria sp. Silwood2]|nr:unnamed protein product [Rotaria sp. Silwood2]CAF2988869.1 unnamed protein product [Rotaria sp. Silwood2]CAF3154779.1 unnamed protein product [Rotaria sp. Silwood2]CAF3964538.1 unnamed protein product [Rotaria sp. Silwood2]CAF4204673.1 unnamed protein product [Rotaria sp. Silwood2]
MADQQQEIRFIENFIIIWVDSKLRRRNRRNEDIQTSITKLRHIVNLIKMFDTCESCIDFIDNKVKQEKVFLIVSGSLGQQLVPSIEHDIKLDSIYVFCCKKFKHEQWARKENHRKIKGIFTDIQDICNQLKEDIKHCQNDLTSIQTVGSQTLEISNHLDASFMYSQLLKDIILSIEYDNTTREQAKQDFIDFCRIYYAHNNAELCVIEEFKQNYSNPSPIWWYTRECFLYSMLNRALCTQDMEILIKMNFFIYDLHQQLEQLHKTTNNGNILTVYRGQGRILPAALDRMKQNQGGLISFNNFLSTSTSQEVSLCFSRKALQKPEKVAVLFEMIIDPSILSVPFALLDKHSYFQDTEKEILFSMHTVFRIGEIKSLDDDNKSRFWNVHLTLTNANDEQLRQLTEHMRIDLSSSLDYELQINMDPTWRLSKLLVHMGEYDKAIKLYEMILDKATHENNLKYVQMTHYQLAELLALYKNDWKRARVHFRKMYSIIILDESIVADEARSDLITVFSTIRNVLGSEQINEDMFHLAIAELLSKLIPIYLDYSLRPLCPLDYQLIVDRYNYIGWVQKNQGKLLEAWASHEHALRIIREHLPPTHPRLAMTYNYMSLLYSTMNDHSGALDCLEKALDIQEKVLQPNHPHLAETHFLKSITFERLNKIDNAFQHAKKAVDIARQAFMTSDDPNMKKYQEQFDKIVLLNQSCNELVL